LASATPLGNNKYKIYVELGYNDKGKRIRKTKTVIAKSERALNKAITAFEIEVSNMQGELDVENITFQKFVDRWMKIYVRPELTIKTRNTYESYLNNGLLDYFGELKINKIKTFHIVSFFKEQKEENKGGLTGKYLVLKSIFTKAIKWEVIENDPMKGVDKPKTESKTREFTFYNETQLKHLIKTLDKVYPKHKIQIKLAALVGLRMAEIAGIRIESINYNNNTILIDKTLQYDKESKKFFLGPTKTKKARTVNVPASFMKEIKEYAKKQKELRIKCGSAWNPLIGNDGQAVNLLFTREDGYPNHVNSMSNQWAKIIKRHKLPHLNFHGLRHTCASFMVSKNVNFKIIQEQLGHTDIRETLNRYSHLTQDDRADYCG
jgi:integrase